MKKIVCLLFFFCGLLFIKNEGYAQTVTIKLVKDQATPEGNELAADVIANGQSQTIVSGGSSSYATSCIVEVGDSANITVKLKKVAMAGYSTTTPKFDCMNHLVEHNGLTVRLTGTTTAVITGKAKKDISIELYAAPGDIPASELVGNYHDYENNGITIEHEGADSTGDNRNGTQYASGSMFSGHRICSTIHFSPPTYYSALSAKIQEFERWIKIITNAAFGIAVLTSVLVFIIHAIKMEFMPSHPIQRRQAILDMISVITGVMSLGSIKLLSTLILGIVAG